MNPVENSLLVSPAGVGGGSAARIVERARAGLRRRAVMKGRVVQPLDYAEEFSGRLPRARESPIVFGIR